MNRPAMTLVELLVVLVILAVLTLVAVKSTDHLIEQARFENTQRTLRNLREALLNINDSSRDAMVTGLIADMGRLPEASLDERGFLTLQELWTANVTFPFAFRSAPDDAEVMLPCGWRGPYVRLAPGTNRLLDGWGWEVANDPVNATRVCLLGEGPTFDAVTNPGVPIAGLRTFGRVGHFDGINPPESYDQIATETFSPNDYLGTVQGQVEVQVLDNKGQDITAQVTGTVTVKVYLPDPNAGALRFVSTDRTLDPSGLATFQFDQTAQIVAGPRVLRASLVGVAKFTKTDPDDNTKTISSTVNINQKSVPLNVIVRPGANVLQRVRIVVTGVTPP